MKSRERVLSKTLSTGHYEDVERQQQLAVYTETHLLRRTFYTEFPLSAL